MNGQVDVIRKGKAIKSFVLIDWAVTTSGGRVEERIGGNTKEGRGGTGRSC